MIFSILLTVALAGGANPIGPDSPRPYEAASDAFGQGLADSRVGGRTWEDQLSGPAGAEVGPLLALLHAGHAQIPLEQGGQQLIVLDTAERYTLARALGRFEWATLREPLQELVDGDPRCRSRLLEALVLRSPRTDLGLLFDALQPFDGERRVGRDELQAFEGALSARLATDGGFLAALPELIALSHPSALMALLRSIGAQAHPGRLAALGDSLGRSAGLDELLLAEIASQAKRLRGPFDRGLVEDVRKYLEAENRSTRAQAVAAIQELGDRSSMRILVPYLDSTDPGLRLVAQQALERLAGTTAGRGSKAWLEWLDAAEAWYTEEAPKLLADVRTGTSADAARALMELSKWSFYGSELVEGVAAGLRRGEPSLQQLACSALGALGSDEALPHLKSALSSNQATTARAAYLSLRRLTDEDHGDRAQAWTEAGW